MASSRVGMAAPSVSSAIVKMKSSASPLRSSYQVIDRTKSRKFSIVFGAASALSIIRRSVKRRTAVSLISRCQSRPLWIASGKVVGASKIARDISDRRHAEEQKDLLLGEMNHRVKNLFALAGGLVDLSARGAASVPALVSDLQGKFVALSRAHSLTLSGAESNPNQITTLHTLIAAVTRALSSRGDV